MLRRMSAGSRSPPMKRTGQVMRCSSAVRLRVAFARAAAADPRILILDEATSNVDVHTEAQIEHGLRRLLAGRTAIVIAHRLSTIRHADRIVVLRAGEVVEEGSHAALMAAGGHYAQLYNTYFRHQSPDSQPVPVRAEIGPILGYVREL